jgi:acetolactate synthase small subunit
MKPNCTLIISSDPSPELPARVLGVFNRRRIMLDRFSFHVSSEGSSRFILELQAPEEEVNKSVQQIRKLIGVESVYHI